MICIKGLLSLVLDEVEFVVKGCHPFGFVDHHHRDNDAVEGALWKGEHNNEGEEITFELSSGISAAKPK